jgi:hypothetical protein
MTPKTMNFALALSLLALLPTAACLEQEGFTRDEAKAALDEATLESQAFALTYDVVEISTNFTMGAAIESAAEELRDWAASQLPCAELTLAGNALTIDFGALGDACVYKGRTYAGIVVIEVTKTSPEETVVTHSWAGFTDGEFTLDGGADVTWSSASMSRHVVYDANWTHGGVTRDSNGDVTQTLIDEDLGLAGGIVINGLRAWTGPSGHWGLGIEDIEARGQDPVPQAGRYVLTSPEGKIMQIFFERVSDVTIEVTVKDAKREYTFEVTAT